jgi:hypothetical protein
VDGVDMSFDSLFCALVIAGALHWLAILVSFVFSMVEALINGWSLVIHFSYVNDKFKPFSVFLEFNIVQIDSRNILAVSKMIFLRMYGNFELVIRKLNNIGIILCIENLFEGEWPVLPTRSKALVRMTCHSEMEKEAHSNG